VRFSSEARQIDSLARCAVWVHGDIEGHAVLENDVDAQKVGKVVSESDSESEMSVVFVQMDSQDWGAMARAGAAAKRHRNRMEPTSSVFENDTDSEFEQGEETEQATAAADIFQSRESVTVASPTEFQGVDANRLTVWPLSDAQYLHTTRPCASSASRGILKDLNSQDGQVAQSIRTTLWPSVATPCVPQYQGFESKAFTNPSDRPVSKENDIPLTPGRAGRRHRDYSQSTKIGASGEGLKLKIGDWVKKRAAAKQT
jgi:hypothetical protein